MHIYKTRLKVLLRTKVLIFWTLIFPIVLGTLFNVAFSNIMESEKFNPIKVGIVQNDNYSNLAGLETMINGISQDNDDQVLDVSYYKTEDDVKEALEANEIKGYYIVTDDIDIVVKKNGMEETIMKYVVDSYNQTYSVITNIIMFNAGQYKEEMISELNSNTNYFQAVSIGNLDMTVLYFYTLIGMVCMYGGFFGVNAVNETEANLSKKAARLSIAPTNKLKNLLCALLAGFTIQIIEALILFLYLIYVLNIDFGDQIPYVLLMLFVGSMAGLTMGTLIGVSNKKDENMKTGIVLSVTMACSFLAGMMMEDIKYIIAEKAPLLAKINPVTMITDGLYSLYYYDNLDRFFYNIISLIIFSIIMIAAAYLFIRRKKYDSI